MTSAASDCASSAKTLITVVSIRGRSIVSPTTRSSVLTPDSGKPGSSRRTASPHGAGERFGASVTAYYEMHVAERKLPLRVENRRLGRVLERRVLHVADNTDDLVAGVADERPSERPDHASVRRDHAADRILTRP